MIEGVQIKQLKRNADERGFLMELIRSTDEFFTKFGQCYVSLNYPGVVRAWHYHKKQEDYFVVVQGMCKVGLYDMREGSPTKGVAEAHYLGDNNNIVLRIPIGVAHGYKTVGTQPSLLINFPTEVYTAAEPDEFRIAWDDPSIPLNWEIEYK
ncbi:MAG TPA: dTDP-4-dehydrorhamnose 3,5-epimerase family protein [Dehalococcoidia bacterium]|nr:dTDP-4-dehydrorhamnose 3,5-epimerase family protein [Dehalococcoidia bacterium]